MALDRLTKVDGGGISTTSDYRVGIITATKFVGPIEGDVTGSITATDGTFSGNVTIGGTLTYEDVTNIDSVGLITARDGIDCNADLDVDGHTNLDNVSIAGVVTATSFVGSLPISSDSNNRVITATGSGGLNGEANLTFDGSKLTLAANSTAYDAFQVGDGLFIGNTTNNISASIFHQGGGANLEIGSQNQITFTTGSTAGNATERLRIDSSGNLVTGAQTSPTSSDTGNIYIKNGSAIGAVSHQLNYVTNAVYNSAWKYITSSVGATRIIVNQGGFQFDTAASGTAGNNITFSNRFNINNSGAIGVGGAYGSAGQVLTSQGSGSATTWTTISGTTINSNTNNYLITGTGTANTLQGESNLTWDGSNLTSTVSGNSGIVVAASGNNAPQIKGQANRGAQNNTLLSMHGVWDGTDVAFIDLQAGPDTSNKDDGQIGFYTRPSGGSMGQRLHINSSGQIIINSTGTEAGTNTKLSVCATGSPGSNPSSIINNAVAVFRATGAAGHAASIGILAGNDGSSAVHFGDTDNDIIGRLIYNHTSGNTSDYFEFYLQGNRRFRIQGNGNLCIGNDSNFTAGAKVEIRDTIGGGGGTGLILNDIGSSGATEGLHIEWRSGTDKQSDQCRIGQTSNSTGSGSHFFIATNSGDTGSSTERLRIQSDGTVRFYNSIYGGDNKPIYLGNANDFSLFHDSGGASIIRYNHSVGGLHFRNNNNADQMIIDSSGRLIIGHTATDDRDGYNSALQVSGTGGDDTSITLGRWSNDASSPALVFSKSRNGTIGSHTVLQPNDYLGAIQFQGDDGSNYHVGASIQARVENFSGAADTDDMSTRILFNTNRDQSNVGNRMIIHGRGSDYNVLYGGRVDILGYDSTNITGGTNSNVLNEQLLICPSAASSYADHHTITFGQTKGDWYQGVNSGYNTSWGLLWNWGGTGGGATRVVRAGIHYDHRASERFKFWSSYGDIEFKVDSGQSGNETAETCNKTAMRMTHDGYVLKPSQPIFLAHKSNGVRITGTGYVTFGQVHINNGSHYDSSNGRFTAPIAGHYFFYTKINAYNRLDMQLRVNGRTTPLDREYGQYNTDSDGVGWWSNVLQRIFYLDENEYVQVYISSLAQNSDPGEWNTFGGWLVA